MKPVRLIIPFPPGGGTDTLGRMVAQKLSEQMGQQVVVDNRPGAGANIGVDVTTKSPPDGYTLVMVSLSNAVGQTAYKLNFDLVKDLAGISRLATIPHVLVVHPSVPVKSVKEYIALRQGAARPAPLLVLRRRIGRAPGRRVLLEPDGRENGPRALQGRRAVHGRAGRRGGGVLLRDDALGDHFRAIREAARPRRHHRAALAYDAGSADHRRGRREGLRHGLVVRRSPRRPGTPKEVIAQLNAETLKAMKVPDVVKRLGASGYEVITGTPEEYTAFVREEVTKWGKIVRSINLKVD